MSNYTKSTNFATKDNLTPGDPLKVVRGTEIDTEFNNIATAVATKTDNSAAAITGGSITGITDLAVADGGTGASTAAGALNNLLPSQTGNANKYLQTDGTNATWDAVTLSTADITGTLAVANGGTGVTSSTGTGNVVLSNSPTLVTPALGTPASGVATNLTGLPISTGISGLGTGVATFLGTPSSANLISAVTDETGTGSLVFATSPTLITPALGTPSALVGTNITGTASGLTAGNVTTNANLTGAVTSVGNATSLGSFTSSQLATALTDETGSGANVFATSPTLVTPILGTPTSATLTNATGLPIATGVSGLGTGIATFLATPSSANLAAALTDETGSGANVFATSPTLVTPILGTPTSATLTNATGLPLTTGVTGTLPTANGGTNLTSFTSGGVVYASSTSALATGSALYFDGTSLGVGTSSPVGKIHVVASSAATSSLLERSTSTTATPVFASRSLGTSSGDMTDGFGPTHAFAIQDTAAVINNISEIGAVRDGADNSGALIFRTYSAGTATTQMRLDKSGNLGLSVTPSAWSTGGAGSALQVNYASISQAGGFDVTNFATNAYFVSGTGYKYIGTATATMYQQSVGSHRFYTAASGTAGNAITFTQAMTLDASGNLGIGTSSPARKLDVNGSIQLPTNNALYISGSSNYLYADSSATELSSATQIKFVANSATRATIDSAGNLGLGVTPSAWNSSYKAIQIGAKGAVAHSGTAVFVGYNWYQNTSGTNTYIATGTAGIAGWDDNIYKWYNAPSGTAGTTITFTQAMELNASGGLKTLNTVSVGNATPSTSGAGITFPATQSASSDANTLDDYEEGTFTAVVTMGSGTATVSSTNDLMSYTKIGRLVTINGQFAISAVSSPSGVMKINLPFSVANGSEGAAFSVGGAMRIYDAALPTGLYPVIQANNNDNTASLFMNTSAGTLTNMLPIVGHQFMITLTYIV